ncbi:zinc-dependent peptidase [uncultured Flavobacterium sp.]|uniref:zinc-dependent peptidase n=1 Tax=uncultured Flavobacterium sp. TaxID=165435 RepID=UPI0030CA43C0
MTYLIGLLTVCILCFFLYNLIIEPLYIFFFRKPIYVHFYPIPKKATKTQIQILQNEFEFYKKLSPRLKKYFEHRVAVFIKSFPFYGKDGLIVTEQMKVLIASTAVMLTFGMRNFVFTIIDKIIIYPDIYYSKLNNTYHKGEFNPRMKAIAFSWKHFLDGYEINTDNLNLGLHEFSHVLHYQGLKNSGTSASIFAINYSEIMIQVKQPANLKRLIDSDYFRVYAFTNEFEFIAVILEHFFETPAQFKQQFPELYEKVRSMINFSK